MKWTSLSILWRIRINFRLRNRPCRSCSVYYYRKIKFYRERTFNLIFLMQIHLASQFSAVRSLPHIGHARFNLRYNFLNSFYFLRIEVPNFTTTFSVLVLFKHSMSLTSTAKKALKNLQILTG